MLCTAISTRFALPRISLFARSSASHECLTDKRRQWRSWRPVSAPQKHNGPPIGAGRALHRFAVFSGSRRRARCDQFGVLRSCGAALLAVTGRAASTCFFGAGAVPALLRGRRCFCCARCLGRSARGRGAACVESNHGKEKAEKVKDLWY